MVLVPAVFQARNRQNLEQSGRLAQNQELLSKRTGQVAAMDRRIGELRDRLHRKKAEVPISSRTASCLAVLSDACLHSS